VEEVDLAAVLAVTVGVSETLGVVRRAGAP